MVRNLGFWELVSNTSFGIRPIGPVALALTLLGGCTTQSLSAGVDLSKAGVAASTQMEQNATLSDDALASLQTAVAFNDGFNNQIGNASSAAFLKHEQSIHDKLQKYGKMLDSLSGAYTALGSLSSYDASGTFNTSIKSLATDANNFGKSVDPGFSIPSEVANGVGAVGGIIIANWQAQQVKDGSRQIEVVLQTVIATLDKPDTKDLLTMNRRVDEGLIDQAAEEALSANVFSYTPMLDSIGAPLKLKAATGADALVAKDTRVRAGLLNSVRVQTDAQLDALDASYDNSLSALKALIPLHENLQNGAPVDATQVNAIIGQLQTIAASVQPAKGK